MDLIDQEPILSATLFHSIDSVTRFFEESEDALPVFLGESLNEHLAAWQALNKKDTWGHWRQAAVAASLDRRFGQRTDRGGRTPIQQFCRAAGIGPAYVGRLTKTHRMFDKEPLDLEIVELLHNHSLSFTHFVIAANHAVQPVVALREALDLGWSAGELARRLTARNKRTLIDATTDEPVLADDDDNNPDVNWRNLPAPAHAAPAKKPRGTHEVKLLLTTKEHRALRHQLQDLSVVLGTQSDIDTVLAVVAWAHAERTRAADVPSTEQAA